MIYEFSIISIILIIIILYFGFKNQKYVEHFITRNTKKIAFCFLITDEINQEKLWFNFFKKINNIFFIIYIYIIKK